MSVWMFGEYTDVEAERRDRSRRPPVMEDRVEDRMQKEKSVFSLTNCMLTSDVLMKEKKKSEELSKNSGYTCECLWYKSKYNPYDYE